MNCRPKNLCPCPVAMKKATFKYKVNLMVEKDWQQNELMRKVDQKSESTMPQQ